MSGGFHPAEKVAEGVERFLAAFRLNQALDAEPEMSEPMLCRACGVLPAAYLSRCFSCHAATGGPC